ncbi:MAG: GrpB family protein [Chloroflexota bacterium]|nr:GrpB family protein [Chloroflexota bacterium]
MARALRGERAALQRCIGHLAIEIQHVGSTAVPGLDAKPIIDIAVAVRAVEAIPYIRPLLVELGYIDRGDNGRDGGYLLVKECGAEVRTHHLHIVTVDGPQWHNYLLFRDRLAAGETLRSRYAQLKQELQARFREGRALYTRAKHGFIRAVLDGGQTR